MNTIKEIEVNGLWGMYDIKWSVCPGVNILSGGNGTGKSTILRSIGELFDRGGLSYKSQKVIQKISITMSDGTKVDSLSEFELDVHNIQIISTFDTAIIESETINKILGAEVATELDLALYMLHAAYLNYQLEVSREVINAMSAGEQACEAIAQKEKFFDTVDSLFAASGKKIDRHNNSLSFLKGTRRISPYQLSSGEKQILVILTTVLVNHNRPFTLIMDEPEISLHFDWQRRLIDDILAINPQTQLIISTHSPAMIMKGWIDRVSEISDLIINNIDESFVLEEM